MDEGYLANEKGQIIVDFGFWILDFGLRRQGGRFSIASLALLLWLAGCASRPQVGTWEGPKQPAVATVEPWKYPVPGAKTITTAHYSIHSTLANDETAMTLAQVLEGAMTQYRRIAPDVPVSGGPLQCFIFAQRSQWDAFTRANTGGDAKIYLQINRGGYTVRDWFVAYFIGDVGTYTVATHEGWHQFAARNFKGRLPPFLEEGIACMFESVRIVNGLPQWNLSVNLRRVQSLRKSIERKHLWPAEKLIAMHAGDVVAQGPEKIEAFYSQSWTFARFLWEGDGGRHRPAFQKLLADVAAGTVYDPTRTHTRAGAPWDSRGVRPMLEHYMGMDWAAIDQAYRAYMQKVAFEEFNAQFGL